MIAGIQHLEYGDRHKKPPNMLFDILKNLKLGIEHYLRRIVQTTNLEGIDFQTNPLKN